MSKKLKRALIFAGLLMFGVTTLSGSDNGGEMHIDTYRVKSGDTFWNVTQVYRDKDARNLYIFDYQDEVRKLNPHITQKGCQLQVGDVITLQYKE